MALLKRKRIGAGDAMEVVTRFVNACNRHDADGVSACLHPDFDSIQPMYPTRNFRGANQVRRNWQAIFDAEPGFRLTVLRSASADDTVWLELHGAGDEAEVAGIFIMGIVGDRIRWARIYSALVEPVPAGMGEPPPPLHEVPRTDARVGDDELVEHELIAPVLDMERSTRRRRRRRAEADAAAAAAEIGSEAGDPPEIAEAATERAGTDGAADVEVPDVGGVGVEPVTVVDVVLPAPDDEGGPDAFAAADSELEAVALVEAGVEPVAVIETDADTAAVGTNAESMTVVGTEDATVVVVEAQPTGTMPTETGPAETGRAETEAPEDAVVADPPAPAPLFADRLDTESVPVIVWDEPAAQAGPAAHDDDPAPAVTAEAPEDTSKRRFGKKRY